MKIQLVRARRCPVGLALLVSALSSAAPAAAEALHVKNVTLSAPREGAADVTIATSGAPHFAARVADGGMRLIVDIDTADVLGAPAAITKGNPVVAGVMTQAFRQQGQSESTTRVLIQLAHQAEYRIAAGPDGLHVGLVSAEKTAPMGTGPAARDLGKSAAKAEGATLTDVRFEHQPMRDRIIVELTGAAEFSAGEGKSGRSTLDLKGVRLPESLQRKLDTGAFGGPVHAVSTYRKNSDPNHVVVEIDRAADAAGAASREGNAIVYTFTTGPVPSALSGIGADGGAARKSRTVAREESVDSGLPRVETTFEASAGARESMTEADQADAFLPTTASQQRRFNGRRIDLEIGRAHV
jgi:type IV pilus assembly protein PilQ